MQNYVKCAFLAAFAVCLLTGCNSQKKEVKIGVSFGVGPAVRWTQEKTYMEEQAKKLGINVNIRFNTTDKPKTQEQDCFELIDSGISVLIIIPRNVYATENIIAYAKEKKVKVISYARIISGQPVDMFVGYDSRRIGQMLGQYLSEMVHTGDYILLRGDSNDHNAKLLYEGAMRYIGPIKNNINIILDEAVPGWLPETAKKMVLEAVAANDNKVDAILAPNDKIAGACAEALAELGVTRPVVITGMDAELDAVRRIVNGTQDVTVYMDLVELARTAVSEAYHMATGQKVNVNAEFNNQSAKPVDSNLITGKLITAQNIDKILIDSGRFTREEIYGTK